MAMKPRIEVEAESVMIMIDVEKEIMIDPLMKTGLRIVVMMIAAALGAIERVKVVVTGAVEVNMTVHQMTKENEMIMIEIGGGKRTQVGILREIVKGERNAS